MRTFTEEQTIFLGTSVPQAAFTAATTDIITSAAHGLQNGDLIWVSTATTLPAGLAASTNYYVIDATTDTFKVSAMPSGSSVDITDAGTGTHTYKLKGKVIYVGDWRHSEFTLNFITTPTMTVKFQGAMSETAPDFNVAQVYNNMWDYIQVIDKESNIAIDGDSGLSCAGAADNRMLKINTDGLQWFTVVISAWTAGTLNVKIKSYND